MAVNSSSLKSFSLPSLDLLTVGEKEGQFVYATEDEFVSVAASSGLQVYPPIFIESHVGNTSTSFSSTHTNQSAFVPVQEHWIKKVWHNWQDEGLIKALEVLSEGDEIEEEGHLLTNCATSVLNCLRKLQTFPFVFSWVPVNYQEMCEEYAAVSLWSSSTIKGIAIHSYLPLFAIATQDDVILIQHIITKEHDFSKSLKDRTQSCITCLEWAPHSNNLLAVGVVGGVVLWHINSAARSISCFLPCITQQPVTTLSWCPQGRFLACGTPSNPNLMIWDVPLRTVTNLKRIQGGGIAQVNWSPSGRKLLVAYSSKLFRVWETSRWTSERWTQLAGRCKASCWSPNGNILIFAVENDCSLYYVNFSSHEQTLNSGTTAAVKCADVSEYCVETENEEVWVGGQIQSLAWDDAGERLAVLFKAASAGARCVAIFRTQCYPLLELIPGGFIQGIEGELPAWVGFTSCHSNGSTLVTGWTSGKVTFTPLMYSLSRTTHEDIPSYVTTLS